MGSCGSPHSRTSSCTISAVVRTTPTASRSTCRQAWFCSLFRRKQEILDAELWGTANEPPFFHHGQFTTLRESVLAHAGEALTSRPAFEAASVSEQDSLIEFLKTL